MCTIVTQVSNLELYNLFHQATEDAELLKAIVVPLEEQIVALKEKLRETDTMLREFEIRSSSVLLSSEALAPWLCNKKSLAEATEELEIR